MQCQHLLELGGKIQAQEYLKIGVRHHHENGFLEVRDVWIQQ